MIVDTSVLLSIFFKEKYGFWAQSQLKKYREKLRMSTVNLTEVLIHLQDRQPKIFKQLREKIFQMPIQFISPTIAQAETSAWARLKFPALNLGDCFAYALAKEEACPVLTSMRILPNRISKCCCRRNSASKNKVALRPINAGS